MPKYCLLVVMRIQHLNVQVQKGHHASMLVTSSGRDPIPEYCLQVVNVLSVK